VASGYFDVERQLSPELNGSNGSCEDSRRQVAVLRRGLWVECLSEAVNGPNGLACLTALDGLKEPIVLLYECILCACGSASCTSYLWHADKFIGRSAPLQANRFIADSRDTAAAERSTLRRRQSSPDAASRL